MSQFKTQAVKWKIPTLKYPPPHDVELLIKYKHGLISGFFNSEQFKIDGTFVFNTYVWGDVEGFIYEYITAEELRSLLGPAKGIPDQEVCCE